MLTKRPVAFKTFYLSALAFLIFIAVLSYALLSHRTNAQYAVSERARVSVQQQLRLQTLFWGVDRLARISDPIERDSISAEMGATISALSSAHAHLLHHLDSDALRALYFDPPYTFDHQLGLFVQASRDFLESPEPAAYQTLLNLHLGLRSGAAALVDQYRQESDASANRTQNAERLVFGLRVALLGLLLLLIFRPMERSIRRNEQQLRETAETLRLSEKRFRLFADQMPHSGVVIFDLDFRHILAAGPLYRRMGTIADDPTGKTLHEALPEDSVRFLFPIYQRILQGEEFTVDRVISDDLAYQSFGTPLRDETGAIIGGILLSHDITAARRAEQALRRSEERYRQMFELNHAIKLVVDPETGQIIEANLAACEFYGYSRDQLQSMKVSQINILSESEILSYMAHTQTEKSARFEFRHRLASGEIRDVEVFSGPLEVDGKSYLFSIVQDITQRKRLEAALQSNEERLRQITSSVQDVITQSDVEDHITFASSSYRTVLGYDPEYMLGRSGMSFVHPDDRAALLDAFKQAIQSEPDHRFNVEARIVHADGHYIWGEIAGKMLFDDQSKCIGAVSVTRDITERRHVQELLIEQERLHTALEKEQELHDLKSRMMERILHEFRTPLAIIQTSTETLSTYFDQLTPDQRVAKARATREGVRRVRDMLDEIGIVLRGGLAPDDLELVPTDLSALCRHSVYQIEKQNDSPCHYVLDLTNRVMVPAEPAALENALMHVLRNAARFSEPSTEIRVKLTCLDQGAELSITDQGVGILPQELTRIFDPFFRGSNIGEMRGLGLGLTIARAIIEAHHGTLSVTSTPDSGTTVTLWLPALCSN
ncbi:MAG TPA: PAS domain-containing sensor histidine kinase [Aggregatilineaceae bacterium]|nr:PAS domain-containing sensor histidine kinase [Aggregatilineaceae bacterium]